MRSIRKIKTRESRRYRRHLRVRKKVSGTAERPRLVVFRSSKHIYAQVVDDHRGLTLVGAGGAAAAAAANGVTRASGSARATVSSRTSSRSTVSRRS